MKTLSLSNRRGGFTLAELMVSSVIIVMILGFLFMTVDQTRKTVTNTTAKVGQFQSARLAFDALTRNLSQAVLNTYWDIDRDAQTKNPIRFRRSSDLHFLIERAENLGFPGASAAKYPTDAVFFQAPLGFTAETVTNKTEMKYRALGNALSTVGYYIEWNEEKNLPEFVKNDTNLAAKRYRYRLMEVIQPVETNMIYNNSNYTTNLGGTPPLVVPSGSPYTTSRDWIKVALGLVNLPTELPVEGKGKPQNSSRVLAENVVALIMIPKLAEKERTSVDSLNDLLNASATSKTSYDTRPDNAYKAQTRASADAYFDLSAALNAQQKKQLHQLPPIVQVTMVAIDEEAGAKLESNSINPPGWVEGLFKEHTTLPNFLKELGAPDKPEPGSLIHRVSNIDRATSGPIIKEYRVFTTDVVLRASKWSRFE